MEYDKYFFAKDLYIVDTDTGVDDAIALLQEYLNKAFSFLSRKLNNKLCLMFFLPNNIRAKTLMKQFINIFFKYI